MYICNVKFDVSMIEPWVYNLRIYNGLWVSSNHSGEPENKADSFIRIMLLYCWQSEILEKSLHPSEGGGSVSDMSLQGSRGVVPSASLIEHLQSLLKQKEGELSNSQVCMQWPLLLPYYYLIV